MQNHWFPTTCNGVTDITLVGQWQDEIRLHRAVIELIVPARMSNSAEKLCGHDGFVTRRGAKPASVADQQAETAIAVVEHGIVPIHDVPVSDNAEVTQPVGKTKANATCSELEHVPNIKGSKQIRAAVSLVAIATV